MTSTTIAAIILGVLALPDVMGHRVTWDGEQWHILTKGMNPDFIRRHVYDLSEFCPIEPRTMRFGDEIIVMSQRPWQPVYKSGVSCDMIVETSSSELGIYGTLLKEETLDCQDYLRVKVLPLNDTTLFCGLRTNVTHLPIKVWNGTIELTWNAGPRTGGGGHAFGFMVLFTAYQDSCFDGQSCFPCNNGRIIDQVHMCNGLDNCGDFSDEIGCPTHYPPPAKVVQVTWPVVFLTVTLVGVLLGFAYVSTLAFKFHREREANRQTRPGEERVLFQEQEQEGAV